MGDGRRGLHQVDDIPEDSPTLISDLECSHVILQVGLGGRGAGSNAIHVGCSRPHVQPGTDCRRQTKRDRKNTLWQEKVQGIIVHHIPYQFHFIQPPFNHI